LKPHLESYLDGSSQLKPRSSSFQDSPQLHNIISAPTIMASPPVVEDQARLLEDALVVVRTQSQLMSRFLDQPVSSLLPALLLYIALALTHYTNLE
jgi:hypothetical protein